MYTYDSGPKTKNYGLLGNIAISPMVGVVIGVWCSSSFSANTELAFMLPLLHSSQIWQEIIKDCEDMDSDEGRNTLPMQIGLMNARSVAYVFILASMVALGLAHYIGPLEYHQIVFHGPAIFILFSLNGPFSWDDHKVSKMFDWECY